jgi:hypothetical protein
MPATSQKQANTARMALAYKHGHLSLKDLPPGAREPVKSMAGMSEASLKDFTHTKKKRKSLVAGKQE